MRGKPSSPLFSLCPWKRIFRASFLGVKIRRISLNNAFTPSFCAPIYIIQCVLNIFKISFKKSCLDVLSYCGKCLPLHPQTRNNVVCDWVLWKISHKTLRKCSTSFFIKGSEPSIQFRSRSGQGRMIHSVNISAYLPLWHNI